MNIFCTDSKGNTDIFYSVKTFPCNFHIPYFLKYCLPLNSVPFLKKLSKYIKKEHYSNICTFEIAFFVNVPGHYLRKYGIFYLLLVCTVCAIGRAVSAERVT